MHKLILTTMISGLVALEHEAEASLLKPEAISVSTLPGALSTTSPYTDDVMLDSVTFAGTTFVADSGHLSRATLAYVRTGRDQVNAEYGDDDTGADGNPNPYVRAGLVEEGAIYGQDFIPENMSYEDQDAAIREAFSTLSLSEGIDGEGTGLFSVAFAFEYGIVDNDAAVDMAPEVLLFERGMNSSVEVRAIIGGSLENPIYADQVVAIGTTDYWATGISIDTQEIGSSQELGAVGIDLNDFFSGSVQTVYGLELSSNDGADLYGQFSSMLGAGEEGSQLVDNDVVVNVPEPAVAGLISLFGGLLLGVKRLFMA